jgi:hypothetical protein
MALSSSARIARANSRRDARRGARPGARRGIDTGDFPMAVFAVVDFGFDPARFDPARFDPVRFDAVRFDAARFDPDRLDFFDPASGADPSQRNLTRNHFRPSFWVSG